MAQTRFKVEDGLLVRGQANITGNTVISGTLELGANVVTGITANGNINPTANVTYSLGNTTFYWEYARINNGVFKDTIEVSNQANLYGGVYLEANISFESNNISIGNTTAMPIVYSTNTLIYDTLKVGNNTTTFLLANSSTVNINSNLALTGASLSLKNSTASLTVANSSNFVISNNSGAPTTIDEIAKNAGFTLYKYIVYVRDNVTSSNSGIQSSEVTLMYDSVGDNVYVSEFNIMSSNTSGPFVTYGASVTSTLLRLTAYTNGTVNTNISFVRTALV
jgi:hypothetical protein